MLSNSSQIYPSETYQGSENSIVMETLVKATFVCTFSDIENYPFNSETCYFKLFISGRVVFSWSFLCHKDKAGVGDILLVLLLCH